MRMMWRKQHLRGEQCPAIQAVCHRCYKRGHFKAQCLSKLAELETKDIEAAFLGELGEKKTETVWKSKILLENQEVLFKLDTGAEVTAIQESTYLNLGRPKLQKPSKILYGPANQPLVVLGQFTGRLVHKEQSCQRPVFVVQGLKNNLLGLPAITALSIIKKIEETSSMDIEKLFPKVFSGLGTMGEEYTIKLKDDAKPHALFTPRNVPIPMREMVKNELQRMEELGVISKVTEPTPWCAGMVVVPKNAGTAVRICVDLTKLNESVLREAHPIPKVDDILGSLRGATVFSKLDANSGFWQIPLSEQCHHLTTFITPFGRYTFNKLPFGISCAPELFQRRMNRILEGLNGVVCLIDDVLVHGTNKLEHDQRLKLVLERIEQSNVTLNREKCAFNQTSVRFLGHLIDKDGIQADPEKVEAILRMDEPQSVSDLRRLLGMVNQLGKFSSKIATLSQPLRELLSSQRAWVWGTAQAAAFQSIKEELTQPTVLELYDSTKDVKVSADASSYGLGAVLLQKKGDQFICKKQRAFDSGLPSVQVEWVM